MSYSSHAPAVLRDELPVADADRPVALVLPEDRVALDRLARERRHEALALQRRDRVRRLFGYFAPARSTHVATRSIRWPGCVRSSPFGGDARRPVGDERRADAALVDPVLVLAERRVADVRPAAAVGDVGVGRRRASPSAPCAPGSRRASAAGRCPAAAKSVGFERRQRRLVRPRRCSGGPCCRSRPIDLGAAAVVLQEQDQRVVELAGPLQLRDDLADALVHAVDHRRVDFHARALPTSCPSTSSQSPGLRRHRPASGRSGRASPPSRTGPCGSARSRRRTCPCTWRCPPAARASASGRRCRRRTGRTACPRGPSAWSPTNRTAWSVMASVK